MKVLKGLFSIACEGFSQKPTAKMLAQADQRIIYLGNVKCKNNQRLSDAFIFSLKPEEALVIDDKKIVEKNGKYFVGFERFSLDSSEIDKLRKKYNHEVFIGTIYNSTDENNLVFDDVYADSLFSRRLYQKGKIGNHFPIEVPKNNFSFPDGCFFRING